MKNQSIRITGAIVLFGAMLLSLACPGGPQDNTKNSEQTTEPETELADDTCTVGTTSEKITKLKNKIKNNIDGNTALKNQFDNSDFTFDVAEDSYGNIVLNVSGKLSGDGKILEDLNKTFKSYLKKSCVVKVTFAESGSPASAVSRFEWGLCEEPMVPCNGECKTSCATASPAPPDANTNSTEAN